MRYKNIIYLVAISVIIAFGFVFRQNAYLSLRPVWLDETFLFFNIYEKSVFGLFSVLDWWQSAPPLFLAAEKIFVSLFGIQEFSIRFFPLLCSLISLPIFYLFSKSFFKKSLSIIIANILFAVNMHLIFYSQELKQYSSDVLCFMLIFLFLKDLSITDFNIKKSVKYITVTTILPFLSLVSYFPIAAWFIRETIINRLQINNLKKLFKIQLPMVVMFIYYYIQMLKPQKLQVLSTSEKFWAQGYLSFDIQNTINILKNFLLYTFEPSNHIILLSLMSVIGIGLLIKNYKKSEYSLLLIILTEVFIVSLLQLYPIYQRVSLFLIPALIIVISMCFDSLNIIYSNKKIYALVLLIIFLVPFSGYDYKYIKSRFYGEVYANSNARLMMQTLKNEYKPNETVVISWPSEAEYKYYKLYFNFHPKREIYTTVSLGTQEQQADELNKLLKTYKSCWFFYSIDFTKGRTVSNTLSNLKNNYKILYDSNNVLLLAIE